jgi:two-component system, OmpR family, phosphate regulon sensor histidine kinase PhoR
LRSFQWRMAIPIILLIVTSMTFMGVYLTSSIKNSQLDNLHFHLEQEAKIVAAISLPFFSSQASSPDILAKDLAKQIDSRVTIIAPDGTVLGDSVENPATMDNHATRPEVKDAITSGIGTSTRYSTTLNEQMMYVAVPIMSDGKILGISRAALPITSVEHSVNHVTRIIILTTAIVAVLAIIAAWFIARTTTRPIRQLTKAVKGISKGQLEQKIKITTNDELGELAHAFNEMSSNLKTTIEDMSREKTKLANILGQMADGVIMTDADGNIILTNAAAGKYFNFKEADVLKRPVIEVVRDHEVDEILKSCLKTRRDQSIQLESGITKKFLRVIAVPLENQNRINGVLILIQDLTELRNLQTMRRELVGNISHELRTPISGIKAMSETLRDGAIDDKNVAQDFLARIENEADRLAQIVAEITQLSRIESGQAELKKESLNLNMLLDGIVMEMSPLAERQNITLIRQFATGLPEIQADRDRIRQTIINLVHNAIKFNKPSGKVIISSDYDDKSIRVSIADTGIGISKEDLPHVFERFYKADKARSGGGSGLGLAIAKHTVLSHSGDISAQSEEGKGSTFTFSLPRQ